MAYMSGFIRTAATLFLKVHIFVPAHTIGEKIN